MGFDIVEIQRESIIPDMSRGGQESEDLIQQMGEAWKEAIVARRKYLRDFPIDSFADNVGSISERIGRAFDSIQEDSQLAGEYRKRVDERVDFDFRRGSGRERSREELRNEYYLNPSELDVGSLKLDGEMDGYKVGLLLDKLISVASMCSAVYSSVR